MDTDSTPATGTPLTDYERFVVQAVVDITGAKNCAPDTTDPAELAAARRVVAACQDARREDAKGKRLPTLRQEWQRSRH